MPAKRLCLTLDLKNDPALIAAFEQYHQAEVIWPEILEGNKETGIPFFIINPTNCATTQNQ